MSAPDEYRKNAADCHLAAENIHDLAERAALLHIAQSYTILADCLGSPSWNKTVASAAREHGQMYALKRLQS